MITFKKVNKIYDNGVKALKNVSLTIPQGEFVYLTGKVVQVKARY